MSWLMSKQVMLEKVCLLGVYTKLWIINDIID